MTDLYTTTQLLVGALLTCQSLLISAYGNLYSVYARYESSSNPEERKKSRPSGEYWKTNWRRFFASKVYRLCRLIPSGSEQRRRASPICDVIYEMCCLISTVSMILAATSAYLVVNLIRYMSEMTEFLIVTTIMGLVICILAIPTVVITRGM